MNTNININLTSVWLSFRGVYILNISIRPTICFFYIFVADPYNY